MRAAGVAAMVYPTMPFNAPRAVDDWPDIRTALGYGNWLGLPEVSVPAGLGADSMPALNLSMVGLPGRMRACWRWRMRTRDNRGASSRRRAHDRQCGWTEHKRDAIASHCSSGNSPR